MRNKILFRSASTLTVDIFNQLVQFSWNFLLIFWTSSWTKAQGKHSISNLNLGFFCYHNFLDHLKKWVRLLYSDFIRHLFVSLRSKVAYVVCTMYVMAAIRQNVPDLIASWHKTSHRCAQGELSYQLSDLIWYFGIPSSTSGFFRVPYRGYRT